MSLLAPLLGPLLGDDAIRTDTAPRLLAYLQDQASVALLRSAAPAVLPCEVRTGDIRTAICDLERQRSPEVLLIDLSGVADPHAAMEELARVCEPTVRVVAVGDSNDIALYRDLRRQGVTEYLFKPLSRDVVEQTLRHACTGMTVDDQPGRLGKLISVVGARGGVGTTTIAVHLGAWLADSARGRTALVDLDLQGGTVALALNLKPEPALREAVEMPERVDDLFMERAMVAASERLAVLAAEEPMEDSIDMTAPAVLSVLNRLQTRHNYVVVDAGRAQSRAARAVVAASSLVVLIGDASVPGLRDLVRLKAALAGGSRLTTVINRRGSPGELPQADIARTLGGMPDHWIPYRPVPLALAAGIGELAFGHCRRFHDAFGQLGADVAGRPAAARGMFRRWLRR